MKTNTKHELDLTEFTWRQRDAICKMLNHVPVEKLHTVSVRQWEKMQGCGFVFLSLLNERGWVSDYNLVGLRKDVADKIKHIFGKRAAKGCLFFAFRSGALKRGCFSEKAKSVGFTPEDYNVTCAWLGITTKNNQKLWNYNPFTGEKIKD